MEGYIASNETLSARQFFLAVRRLADSLSYGTDRSPFLGSGLEYVQSRPYQFGDSIRAIDWRVTARTGKYHVKEHETPKRLPVYLLVDGSASMAVSSVKRSKYETAVFVAGGLAYACLDRISPVGFIGVGGQSLRVEPTLSKQQVMESLHRLRRFRYDEPTTLAARLKELIPSLSHRALLIVLSDLHEPAAIPILRRAAKEHDCVVLHFRDPAEVSLHGAGLFRAREAETGRALVTHGRRRWVEADSLREELRRRAIDYLLIDTDQPFAHRLRSFFRGRDLLGRGAR